MRMDPHKEVPNLHTHHAVYIVTLFRCTYVFVKAWTSVHTLAAASCVCMYGANSKAVDETR